MLIAPSGACKTRMQHKMHLTLISTIRSKNETDFHYTMTQLLCKEEFGDLNSTDPFRPLLLGFGFFFFLKSRLPRDDQAKTWTSMRSGDLIFCSASQPRQCRAVCMTSQESQDLCESPACVAAYFSMAAPAYAFCTIWSLAPNSLR